MAVKSGYIIAIGLGALVVAALATRVLWVAAALFCAGTESAGNHLVPAPTRICTAYTAALSTSCLSRAWAAR